MKLLIDTHLIVWAADDPARVPRRAREAIAGAERLVFSVATLWEVAIKVACGRSGIRTDPGELRLGLLANGYEELPVLPPHAITSPSPSCTTTPSTASSWPRPAPRT